MNYTNRTVIRLVIALAVLLPIEASVACGAFGKGWYKMGREGLGSSSPVIEIEYRDGLLFRYGKIIQKDKLLRDLKGSVTLQPHPRVLFTLGQDDAKKVENIVKEIERSGICRDSGCLYQFRTGRWM